MEGPLLNDKPEYPDDGILSRRLGKAKPLWDAFVEYDERGVHRRGVRVAMLQRRQGVALQAHAQEKAAQAEGRLDPDGDPG